MPPAVKPKAARDPEPQSASELEALARVAELEGQLLQEREAHAATQLKLESAESLSQKTWESCQALGKTVAELKAHLRVAVPGCSWH